MLKPVGISYTNMHKIIDADFCYACRASCSAYWMETGLRYDKQARDGSIIKCLLIPEHLRGQHHHEIETTAHRRVRCAASHKPMWHKLLRKARRPSESLA